MYLCIVDTTRIVRKKLSLYSHFWKLLLTILASFSWKYLADSALLLQLTFICLWSMVVKIIKIVCFQFYKPTHTEKQLSNYFHIFAIRLETTLYCSQRKRNNENSLNFTNYSIVNLHFIGFISHYYTKHKRKSNNIERKTTSID